MRDFSQELRTLEAERKRVDGIAHSSDAIALLKSIHSSIVSS